ncbi:hypothetical protein [Caballeronia sp. GAWG1-5s-s]|uniref:hypothetical protein n=1 Tax=Caballeronia sp. GAWG1-5s-s TaxID=2921743 RepID=UPI002027D60F|nr:hypothetical protein [Caballeronia sp. GAWG1-5s-s]
MLCFDYAVGDVPAGWLACHIGKALRPERAEMYFREHGGRHHALHDVRANRYAMPD